MLTQRFESLDLDGDGKVNHREVDHFIKDPEVEGDDAAALAALKWGFAKKELRSRGVDSLDAFQEHSKRMEEKFSEYRTFLKESPSVFDGKPDPNSIRQGLRGSCTVLATLINEAQTSPESLVNAIVDNGDSYQVSLVGLDETVPMLTDGERLIGARANGTWASIFEKAFSQKENWGEISSAFNVRQTIHRFSGRSCKTISSLRAAGADPDLKAAAAESEHTLSHSALESALHDALLQAHQSDAIVIAESSLDPSEGLMRGSHAYAIKEYDAEKRELTIQNPWGYGEIEDPILGKDTNDDGEFRASLSGFLTNFRKIYIESDEMGAKWG